MTERWRKWALSNDGFIGAFLMFASAFVFLFIRLSQPAIHSRSDLKFIRAPLRDYNFVNGSRGHRSYDFRLSHFPTRFRINANFLSFFDEKDFRKLQDGDTLTIGFSNVNHSQWPFGGYSYLLVYSITADSTDFLNCEKAIQRHNSFFPFYAFAFFLLAGIATLFMVFKLRRKIKTS